MRIVVRCSIILRFIVAISLLSCISPDKNSADIKSVNIDEENLMSSTSKTILVPFLKKNGKFVYVDSATMEVKIQREFDECNLFYESMAAIKINQKWGFIDNSGKIIINPIYEKCGNFKEGLAPFKLNGKWGFIDKQGMKIISANYDLMPSEIGALEEETGFIDGVAEVGIVIKHTDYNDWFFGYIDKYGNTIIPCRYNQCYKFSEGIAAMGIENMINESGINNEKQSWWFFNKRGQRITTTEYDEVGNFHEGLAPVAKGDRESYKILRNAKWGYIDLNGKVKIQLKYNSAKEFSEGLAAVGLDGNYGYIDHDGNVAIPFVYKFTFPFSDGLAAVIKDVNGDNRIGFIDKNGKTVIDFKYMHAGNSFWFKDGFAVVALEHNKFGLIDKAGNLITKKRYDIIEDFKNGLAIVGIGTQLWGSDGYVGFEGKWGLVNYKGEEITELIYDAIEIQRNFILVNLGEKKFYLDKIGREFKDR